MAGFKEPSFQERTGAAARAKAAALSKHRARVPVDEATLEARLARSEARAAADAEKRRVKEAAKAEAVLLRQGQRLAASEAAAAASRQAELTEAEKKAARDARYAARKARK